MEHNPYDSVAVPTLVSRVPRPAAVAAASAQLLQELRLTGSAHALTAALPLPRQLLAAARVTAATSDAHIAALRAAAAAAAGEADADRVAAVAEAQVAAELEAGAVKLLAAVMQHARLYRAVLAKIAAALSTQSCSSGTGGGATSSNHEQDTGASSGGGGQQSEGEALAQPPSSFLGHAHTLLAGLVSILERSEAALEEHQQRAAQHS